MVGVGSPLEVRAGTTCHRMPATSLAPRSHPTLLRPPPWTLGRKG